MDYDVHTRCVWWIMIQAEFQVVHCRSPICIINITLTSMYIMPQNQTPDENS